MKKLIAVLVFSLFSLLMATTAAASSSENLLPIPSLSCLSWLILALAIVCLFSAPILKEATDNDFIGSKVVPILMLAGVLFLTGFSVLYLVAIFDSVLAIVIFSIIMLLFNLMFCIGVLRLLYWE